ncbi:MAG: phosphotransferase [Pseudomonadota bacterium]
MIPIPDSAEEVTADWLTAVLQDTGVIDGRVAQVESEHFGEGVGMMSFMLRCRLGYEGPSSRAPTSLIVKLEPKGAVYRDYIETWHGFEREIRFYQEVAPQARCRVPAFYHGASDEQRAVIVLEDLGHLRVVNQVRGLRDRETVAAVRQIARLHGRYWDSPALVRLDWLPRDEPRLTLSYEETWDEFEAVYGLRIGPAAVDLGRRLAGSLDWLRAEIASRPHTVCHGDLRADNIFFGPDGSDDAAVIFDWQVCVQAFGALDLARLLGGSEPAAERASHANEVFAAWHDTLLNEGVTGYDRADAFADLRLGVLVNLCTPVRILSIWGADAPGRKGQLLDALATRMFALAMEVDAGARLPP